MKINSCLLNYTAAFIKALQDESKTTFIFSTKNTDGEVLRVYLTQQEHNHWLVDVWKETCLNTMIVKLDITGISFEIKKL